MRRIYLISIDLFEHFKIREAGLDMTNMVEFLLGFNDDDIIVGYSRDERRSSSVKESFPISNTRLKFTSRENVMANIRKYNHREDYSYVVIGRKNKDFEMAVNNKLILITPNWLDYVEDKTKKYGIIIENFDQFKVFINTLNNQNSWFSKLELPDDTIILSLSDSRTYDYFIKSEEEKEVIDQFRRILKSGNRNFYEMFLYHFLASISNNKALFRDINIWGIFPSSKGTLDDNEMFKFKEIVRWMMKIQPIRGEEYANYPNLLVRHTPTYKSHDIKDVKKRINIGSANHFRTIHLNPCYNNRLQDKNICILDDYLTHGNSFECARNLLRSAGANKIIFVTLGRFVSPYQYQEYRINGDVFTDSYSANLVKQREIPKSSFDINNEAKDEVENLHKIFNL